MEATSTTKSLATNSLPSSMPSTMPVLSRNPSICIKPSPNTPSSAASPAATSPSTPSSLTTKEWVIPPRPKPGRKPATDTPPTKRKAQNRAAQRAFRERRAARVGELEEQMKKIEEEDEEEQSRLRVQVERLSQEVERYQTEMGQWISRCRELEKELSTERAEKEVLLSRTQILSTDAVLLPPRTSSQRSPHVVTISTDQEPDDTPLGCGNCSSATRCQCIDEAFNMPVISADDVQSSPNPKRPHSPPHPHSHKRIKAEPQEDLETDFTSAFSSHSHQSVSKPAVVSPASVVVDLCGFCQDGTPCICAEMAVSNDEDGVAVVSNRPVHNHIAQSSGSTMVPAITELSQFTPPPSEGDVSSSQIPTKPANPCASGPGTCAQCRADPNSTLFCKSLAASRSMAKSSNVTNPSGCCGGNSSSGSGCCMTQSQAPITAPSNGRATRSKTAATTSTNVLNNITPLPSRTEKLPSIRLSCADTYTTLSRHPGYGRASGEIATWMPKLHDNNAKQPPSTLHGRPAMEIDAANVMSVLREFDRRFGEGK